MIEQINIDKNSNTPLANQIYSQICQAVISDKLQIGTQLPTLRELESKLGVSMSTIRQAFNALTKDGILKKKTRLGTFVCGKPVDSAIQSPLTTDKEMSVSGLRAALLLCDKYYQNNEEIRFMRGFEHNIAKHGGRFSVVPFMRQNEKGFDEFMESLKEFNAFCYYANYYSSDIELMRLMKINKNIITCNYRGEMMFGGIRSDWKWAIMELMSYLFNSGHRKIGMISFSYTNPLPLSYSWVADRENAFLEFAGSHNLPVGEEDIFRIQVDDMNVIRGNKYEGTSYNGVDNFINETGNYSAIIGVNDDIAIGFLKRVRELGIDVPGILSIAGIDNNMNSLINGLTTVMSPSYEQGIKAANMLMEQYCTPTHKVHIEFEKPILIPRETTAILPETRIRATG